MLSGVLSVAPAQTADMGPLRPDGKVGTVVARRPTNAGAGLTAADGGLARHAATSGLASIRRSLPKLRAVVHKVTVGTCPPRQPCLGAQCPRLF